MNPISFQYPLFYLAVALILATAAAFILYYRTRQLSDLTVGQKLLLAGLRAGVIFLLIVLLMNPMTRIFQKEIKKPEIIIALDESASMTAKDSNWVNGYLQMEKDLMENLSDKYSITQMGLGQTASDERKGSFDQPGTNVESLFDRVNNMADFQQLKGLILVTDGIYNTGRNPLYHPMLQSIPIYTVFQGDSIQEKDLSIQRIFHNEIIFSGDKFGLEFDIQAWLCENSKSSIRVSRMESGSWTKLSEKNIEIDKPGFFSTLNFTFDAEKPGIFRYRIECSSIPGEKNIQNNIRDFYIEVLDARKKVMILAYSPHPDLAAIKSSLEEHKNYEVNISYITDQPVISDQTQLVIFHNLPHINHNLEAQIVRLDALKIPRIFILGTLTDIPSFNKRQSALTISGGQTGSNESQAILLETFNSFTLSDYAKSTLLRFPPLTVPFGQYQTDPGASVLLRQKIGKVETEYPLWLISDQNGIKTMVICGEGLWRWKMNNYVLDNRFDGFQELLIKSIQFTSSKEDRRKFRSQPSKKVYSESEPVVINAELYNDAYELINQPDVKLSIRSEDKKEYTFTLGKRENFYEINAGSFSEGDYTFVSTTEWNGTKLRSDGRFSILKGNPELNQLVGQPGLLRNISMKSGGRSYLIRDLNQLGELLTSDEKIKPVVYQTLEVKPFIDRKWLFFLIFLLLGSEWFLRRYWGSY